MPAKRPPSDRLAHIRGIVLDVDGVLTDGKIIYTDDGHELKQFHVQDGASIKLLMDQGVSIAVITGRRSPMVARRTRELGIDYVSQGAKSKPKALQALIADGFPEDNLAAIGDDIQDLDLFSEPMISLAITVPNGHPEVLRKADWTTQRSGGDGVVAEIAEHILKAQSRWPY
ncbi:MAG: HAD hydrolase family protein [Pseudomonadales bacterium]|jgi:3-deoxy-D-manno-octulosonate 8-phosphate phosphatase (KDO 8-P phosphatase)|nr:HAD hydrolase family protein [Pseudomonadales bacterium]